MPRARRLRCCSLAPSELLLWSGSAAWREEAGQRRQLRCRRCEAREALL